MGEKIKKAIGVKGDFKTAILPMINYSYANMFMGGAGYIISMYFTIFLTDVVNIKLKYAGVIVMIATIWDAVTDPAMGIITDRTRAATGKHRRYLLWGIPLLLVSVLQLIRVWRAPSIKAPKHGRLDKVFIVFVVVCAAIMSFKTLGFFVSTGAMLAVLMLVLGERRFLLIAGMSAGWMLFTWLVFNKLLLLGLPVGTLFAR